MRPGQSTGYLYGKFEGRLHFLGTAFAYRTGRHFLTAAHCIANPDILGLGVLIPGAMPPVGNVRSVEHHPSADLAVLDMGEDLPAVTPFQGTVDNLTLGEQFFAFGYPEDSLEGSNRKTYRLFTGNFQRFFRHQDLEGREYEACEMSIAAPQGLSGGPVFRPDAPTMLTGIVTANFDSSTGLEAHEEEDNDGRKRVVQYRRVISYGVSQALHPFSEWLDEIVSRTSA